METTLTTTETPETPEFHITDQKSAEWVLEKIATLKAREALVRAQSDRLLRQIASDQERLMGRFGAELEQWARQEIERAGGRRKSLVTLFGTLAFRTVPPRLERTPDAADHARAMGFLSDPAPDLPAFLAHAKAHFEATGELLPGVQRTEAAERFSLKFAEDAPSAED